MAGFACRNYLRYCMARISDLYFVSITNKVVFGRKCYETVKDIPDKIDLAVICTPKNTVDSILDECAFVGIKAAVVFASGYGETNNLQDIELEKRLVEKANKLDIALMGPNCAGFINFADDMFCFGFMFEASKEKGKIGLVSQSGQVCMAAMDSQKGCYSYVISSGNSSAIVLEDYIEFLLEDKNTEVIAVYIEGIKNPNKFVNVLKKSIKKKKPIVMLKVGKSEQGKRIAGSHTGSMVGSNKSINALLKKYCVIQADDLEEMICISNALSTLTTIPNKNAIACINISGGESAISADVASMYGLNLIDFSRELTNELQNALPSFATAINPIDLTGGSDGKTMEKVCDILFNSGEIELIISSLQIVNEIKDTTIFDYADGLIRYKKRYPDNQIVIVPLIEDRRQKEIYDRLQQAGIPILASPYYGYKVIKKLIDYSESLSNIGTRTLQSCIPESSMLKKKKISLSESESKKLFEKFGINIPKEIVVKTHKQAIVESERIGYPVVMKIESNEILHKTEIGGVKLGINNSHEVEEAFDEIIENADKKARGKKYNGVLIQKMLDKGLEIILGVNNDEQFGPMVLLGIGGIFTELIKDYVIYPAPINTNEAMNMINSLKCAKLFYGYRGKPNLDVQALAQTIVSISNLAVHYKDDLIELDINPLFVYEDGKGTVAIDGLIVMSNSMPL